MPSMTSKDLPRPKERVTNRSDTPRRPHEAQARDLGRIHRQDEEYTGGPELDDHARGPLIQGGALNDEFGLPFAPAQQRREEGRSQGPTIRVDCQETKRHRLSRRAQTAV